MTKFIKDRRDHTIMHTLFETARAMTVTKRLRYERIYVYRLLAVLTNRNACVYYTFCFLLTD